MTAREAALLHLAAIGAARAAVWAEIARRAALGQLTPSERREVVRQAAEPVLAVPDPPGP